MYLAEGGDMERTRQPWMFSELTSSWWLFLVTGIVWLIIALIILRFDTTSLATVGALLGFVLLVAGANELMIGFVRPNWSWAHIALGVLFLLGGIIAFTQPFSAFWALASILGLLLVLKGSLDIILSAMTRALNEFWWLGLVTGILEVVLGVWASQQVAPARAALVVLWVGLGALLRGISEIVLAFHIRHLHQAVGG
jgi:uncharacterized membrane protein HdeD (DUF308 family)